MHIRSHSRNTLAYSALLCSRTSRRATSWLILGQILGTNHQTRLLLDSKSSSLEMRCRPSEQREAQNSMHDCPSPFNTLSRNQRSADSKARSTQIFKTVTKNLTSCATISWTTSDVQHWPHSLQQPPLKCSSRLTFPRPKCGPQNWACTDQQISGTANWTEIQGCRCLGNVVSSAGVWERNQKQSQTSYAGTSTMRGDWTGGGGRIRAF